MYYAIIVIMTVGITSVSHCADYDFTANEMQPFGKYNPAAPKEVKDFDLLIGQAECKSTARIDQNNWAAPIDMIWTFKYTMNGMAIQDDTLKSDGTHSGSLRQFNAETGQWLVHYYTTKVTPEVLPAWQGGKDGENLVFWRAQKAPNGMDGFYRLTFHDMTRKGYQWSGDWVDQAKTMIYPTWKITCQKIFTENDA